MDNKDCIKVVAGVFEDGGRILIAKRKKGGFSGGKWEFPGGKLEDGETPQECLKRELMEEFGIESEVSGFICSTRHPLNCQTTIDLSVYKVNHVAGEFYLNDHDEIRWIRRSELNQYDFPEADYAVVRRLMEEEDICHL
jgi:mutator protein MutT